MDHFFKKFALKGTIRFAMRLREGFLRQKRCEEIIKMKDLIALVMGS